MYTPAHPPMSSQPMQTPIAAPRGFSAEAIAGAAKPALVLIGLRAALPVLLHFLPLGRLVQNQELLDIVYPALEGGLALLALIFYFVWFSKMYDWVRATRGARFSNGMAIGGWFIPFANFAIPYMALRDAVRRGAGDKHGGLLVLWWLSYLGTIVLSIAESVFIQLVNSQKLNEVGIDTINLIHKALYWSGAAGQVVAWGLLAFLVDMLTKRASQPAVR
jgi:hypothetical protein